MDDKITKSSGCVYCDISTKHATPCTIDDKQKALDALERLYEHYTSTDGDLYISVHEDHETIRTALTSGWQTKDDVKSALHKSALKAMETAKDYRDAEKEDKEMLGEDYDRHSYGAGFNYGAAHALEDFAEAIWQSINDMDIPTPPTTNEGDK